MEEAGADQDMDDRTEGRKVAAAKGMDPHRKVKVPYTMAEWTNLNTTMWEFQMRNPKALKDVWEQNQQVQLRQDWVFMYQSLARHNECKSRKLGDLFCFVTEGPMPHAEQALVVASVCDNGKANKDGRREYLGTMRHRDPAMCAQLALAMQLFWRFEILTKLGLCKLPDFSLLKEVQEDQYVREPETWRLDNDWAALPLSIKSCIIPEHEVRYNEQHRRMVFHLKEMGLHRPGFKVMHAGRNQGANVMGQAGLARDEILHHGRWLYSPFDRCYAAQLLPRPMLTLAGFKEGINELRYHMYRGRVKVPVCLTKQLWDWVDIAHQRAMKVRCMGSPHVHVCLESLPFNTKLKR